jgi:hypothetical protein
MPETRHLADVRWHELTGPTYAELGHRDTIDWHYHDVQQLVYPSSGVLAISTAVGTWVVPPQRAVWIPSDVAHSHQAHGPTQMRTLSFPATTDPLGLDSPAVLTVGPLLGELIVALTSDTDAPYTARQRGDLERVALDQIRRVGQLPVRLPALGDDRLRERADAEPAVPAGGGDELPAMGAPSTACNTRWSCSRPARRSPARRWPAAGRTRARSSRPFGAHSAAHQGSSSGPKLRRSDLAMVRLRSGAQNAAAGRLLGPDGAVRRVPDVPPRLVWKMRPWG